MDGLEALLSVGRSQEPESPLAFLQQLESAQAKGGGVQLVFRCVVLREVTGESKIQSDVDLIHAFANDCVNLVVNRLIEEAQSTKMSVAEVWDQPAAIHLKGKLIDDHLQRFFEVKRRCTER